MLKATTGFPQINLENPSPFVLLFPEASLVG